VKWISPDGKFLYGSNRRYDRIVVYAIDSLTGGLTLIEHVPMLGEHLRNFALLPDGQFVYQVYFDSYILQFQVQFDMIFGGINAYLTLSNKYLFI
jgi:6-phosphogluconolactonase (cycloisomerase 2 family)